MRADTSSFYKAGIHYSVDIERTLLGACMLEQTAFGRIIQLLDGHVFYHDANRIVFDAFKEMWDKSVPVNDMSLVLSYLSREKGIQRLDDANTGYYLILISRDVVSTANLERYAIILREMYIERELIRITQSGLSKEADTGAEISRLQQELNQLMFKKSTDNWQDMSAVLVKLMQHMDNVRGKDMIGVTTGFKTLDQYTGGWAEGGMYIIGARPSVGKSALLGKMVIKAAQAGKHVGVVSLEMPDIQIGARLASMESDIEFWRIFRAKIEDQQASDRLYHQMGELANLPIKISDKTQVNLTDIKAKVIQLKHRGQLDVLFIDYLQLMDADPSAKSNNREQEVAKISRGLKILAMEYSIPIIVLCQLNRESEKRNDKRPRLADLRESGSLEQDADGTLLLHRPWMAGIQTNEQGESTECMAELIIAKWRNGQANIVIDLGFDGEKMRFYDPAEQNRFKPLPKNYYESEKEDDEPF
ncbi:replicative DNA helicase [Chitinophaga agrisoli]|uniref:DNA 5'-3' helicase n=1 Tax=Chitinophaga agrisoli TaxID=2607653 RepID=A0A5B2VX06_9BACT|nr:replicative DNA helicase [Chitinophaga agrisoli]KAA2242852.1 replicative DNA helicase [Chitinophaga agrisoli]